MGKRSRILGVVASLIVTILLEIITSLLINYDLPLRIVSSIALFGSILLTVIDIYWIKEKKFVEYHRMSVKTGISATIMILLCCLTFCGKNLEYRMIYSIAMVVGILVFIYFWRKQANYKFE